MAKPKQTKAKAAARSDAPRAGDEQGTSKPAKTRKSGGDRPSTFTDAIGAEICERLIGGERLDSICKDAHMPASSRVTVFRWRRANPAFDAAYLSARWDQREAIEDEVLNIAETETDIARARVKLDARRIVLGRLASTYGAPQAQAEQQPFDLAGAIAENRRKLEELKAEVGHERAQRILEDKHIEDACNPPPGATAAIVRGNQRVAMHILEERKKALLAMPTPAQPI